MKQERFSASRNHRGNDAVVHALSEQPQSRAAVDKGDDYSVLYHEEAIPLADFMSATLENHIYPRGNPMIAS